MATPRRDTGASGYLRLEVMTRAFLKRITLKTIFGWLSGFLWVFWAAARVIGLAGLPEDSAWWLGKVWYVVNVLPPWWSGALFGAAATTSLVYIILRWQLISAALRWRSPSVPEVSAEPTSSEAEGPTFDMPIHSAIEHLLRSTPHSYTRSDWAEQAVFRQLYKMMCDGTLEVAGSETEFGMVRPISPEECLKFEPRESIIPLSPAAPDGIAFILSPPIDKPPKEHFPIDESGAFRNLRVRSRDLYRFWPRPTPRAELGEDC